MTQDDWTKLKETLDEDPEKAFECLYTHMWDKLFSLSLNYVRDQAVAQEIVQDVFVTLWVKRKRLESVSDIRAFAMRAVQNRIYDHFDKQAVHQRYAQKITLSETIQVDSTQQQVEYNETFSLIDTEIEKLPDTTRKIFRLSRFERFSNEEIAARLKLSVKAVEYHITQALKQLRIKLKYIGTLLLFLTGIY